jgi:hypothetical protein
MDERLSRILDSLLEASRDTGEVTLDQLGDAIALEPITVAEIGALMDALEDRLRIVVSPQPTAAADLRRVLPAARVLQSRLGHTPSVDEIATETGLSGSAVRAALLLGRVIGRS